MNSTTEHVTDDASRGARSWFAAGRLTASPAAALALAACALALVVAIGLAVTGSASVWVIVGASLPCALLVPVTWQLMGRLTREVAERRFSDLHDGLTMLPNRVHFYDVVNERVAHADHEPFAVVLLGLDRFKDVNDTLGYDRGDDVLREVGRRLEHTLRESDLVARLGGDEFGILLWGVAEEDAARNAVEKLQAGFAFPIALGDMNVPVEASMGIALAPMHGEDPSTLLHRADVAMNAAKGVNAGALIYDSSVESGATERLGMFAELRRAIEEQELVLYYQPKARLADGTVEAVEALVRWQHPERGLVPPNLFIPFAEETGLITRLTLWVVDEALRQAQLWRTQGAAIAISVNISAKNLRDQALCSDIAGLMRKWSADAHWLCLEITESAVMEDPQGAVENLTGLADMGLELALDDYGTGHSSLTYLKRLPLSELKIDRSFVSNFTGDQADALIISSTIELSHGLGMRVVAEGVETEADWLGLQVLGCDIAQGYFLGRPMPAGELMQWLRESGRGVAVPTDLKPIIS